MTSQHRLAMRLLSLSILRIFADVLAAATPAVTDDYDQPSAQETADD